MTEEAKKLGDECVVARIFENEDGNIRSTSCLSKREYFTGLALQGILSNSDYYTVDCTTYAQDAVKLAKALLEELSKTE